MINASIHWEAIQRPEGDKGEGLGDNNKKIEPIAAQGRHCQVETTKREKRAHEKAPQEEHLLPSLTVFA